MSYTPTKQQIQEYIPVSNSFVPDNFQSFIRKAEQKWMHKYLSKVQYDAIIAADDQNDDVTDMIHRAVISFAYYLYVPFANVSLSNAGITQARSDSQMAAKPEDVENLRQACYEAGWEELEAVLIMFEANLTTYALWAASAAKTTADELLFTNATDFSKYVNIRELRRVFVLLIAPIRLKQMTRIKLSLGSDLYTDVKQNSNSELYQELIQEYIRPALAHLAMAYAIPNISVQLGYYDMALMFDNTGANKQKASAKMLPATAIDYLVQFYQSKADELLCLLTDYLVENSETFPLYGAVPPPDPELIEAGNSRLYGDNGVVGF